MAGEAGSAFLGVRRDPAWLSGSCGAGPSLPEALWSLPHPQPTTAPDPVSVARGTAAIEGTSEAARAVHPAAAMAEGAGRVRMCRNVSGGCLGVGA